MKLELSKMETKTVMDALGAYRDSVLVAAAQKGKWRPSELAAAQADCTMIARKIVAASEAG